MEVNNDDNEVTTDTINPSSFETMKTPIRQKSKDGGHQHALHNSLVEFTFADNLLSSNELTLTRLNSLFDRIADRNAMAIRADKLFRLIQKTDRNDVATERFQDVLNVGIDDNGKIIGRNGILRVVSRGPFLAMFKHESKSFVNSLENVVRSLSTHKKKRKDKKSVTSKSSSDDGGKSAKASINSAPVPLTACKKSSSSKTLDKPSSSLKRKKSEDKTGMIITTDKDYCDEMSAVSVSPVNCGGENEGKVSHPKNTHVMKSIQESPSKERTLVKSDSIEGILTSAKKSSSKKSRRNGKSGKGSNRSARKQKKISDRSYSTPRNNASVPFDFDNENQTTGSLHRNEDSNHSRNNSASETIRNIREVMNANTTPRGNKRLKTYHNPPPDSSQSNSTILPNNYGFHPGYGTSHFHHPLYDSHHPMIYPMPYGNYSVMPWQPQPQNESTEETIENVGCDGREHDCFIFGSVVTFFKRFFKNNNDDKAFNNDYCHHGAFIPSHPQGAKMGHFPVFPQYNGHWQVPTKAHSSIAANSLISQDGHAYDHHGFSRDTARSYENGRGNKDKYNRDRHSDKYSRMYEEIYSKSDASSCGDTNSYMIRSITESGEKESRPRDNVNDTSNKLKVYDYKPSIKLPEPERYEFKGSNLQESSKLSVYSKFQKKIVSNNNSTICIDHGNPKSVSVTLKNDASTERFNPGIMKLEEASIVTESTTEESTVLPYSNARGNVSNPHLNQVEMNVSEKTRSSSRCEERTHDQLQNSDKDRKKKLLDSHKRPSKLGVSRSISERKSSTMSQGGSTLSLSRGSSVSSSTSSRTNDNKKRLLDSHLRPSKIGGSRSISEGRSSTNSQGGSALSLSRGLSFGSSTSSTSSKFCDQLQNGDKRSKKKLLDSHKRPSKIGRSRSVSEGKSPTSSRGGRTWSLSRGSSVGSTTSSISSLTGTSELFPRNNSRSTAYHHYR